MKRVRSDNTDTDNNLENILNQIKKLNTQELVIIRNAIREQEMNLWKTKLDEMGLIKHKLTTEMRLKLWDEHNGFHNYEKSLHDKVTNFLPKFITDSWGSCRSFETKMAKTWCNITLWLSHNKDYLRDGGGYWSIEIILKTNDQTVLRYTDKYIDTIDIVISKSTGYKIPIILNMERTSECSEWSETYSNSPTEESKALITPEIKTYWQNTFSKLIF